MTEEKMNVTNQVTVFVPKPGTDVPIKSIDTLKETLATKSELAGKEVDRVFTDYPGEVTDENHDDLRKALNRVKSQVKKVDDIRTGFFKPINSYSKLILAEYKKWSDPLFQRIEEKQKEVSIFLQKKLEKESQAKKEAEKTLSQFEDALEEIRQFVIKYVSIFENHEDTQEDEIKATSGSVFAIIGMVEEIDLESALIDDFSKIYDKIMDCHAIKSLMGKSLKKDAELIERKINMTEKIRSDYSTLYLNLTDLAKDVYRIAGRQVKTIGLRKTFNINIVSIKRLPDFIFDDPNVIEAINKAILAEAKVLEGQGEDPNQIPGAIVRISYE